MKSQVHKSKSRIPEFASIEEEAEFWDTHDTTDYEDEFQPVQLRFAKDLSDRLTLRLEPELRAQLDGVAREQGVAMADLVHAWIVERLRKHPEHTPSA